MITIEMVDADCHMQGGNDQQFARREYNVLQYE